MSPGDEGRAGSPGWRLAQGVLLPAAFCVALVYVNLIFQPLPLYAGDEGAYLIRALYGKQLRIDPTLAPHIQELSNTAFLLIIRAVTYATENLLQWMRVLGACAYFGGLLLVWRATRARRDLPAGAGFLLLALAFPYYRYTVTAMPEGWYVGLLGVLVLTTARLYLTRPIAHALLAGALTGVLVLLKPHGVAVAAAFIALAIIDAMGGRRDLRVLAARLLLFAIAFLAAGNLVQLAANEPIAHPFTFFVGGHYTETLERPTTAAGIVVALKSLALGVSAMLLLAGVPIATGLARIATRWRRSPRDFRLDASELTFLLILLSTAATLAMVAVFSMKLLALYGAAESNRLWGRYFEFFAPMLWLAAAPFITEFERDGGRTWRLSMATIVQIGLAGLSAFLWTDVMLFPWDAAALTAFFVPNLQRFDLAPIVPYFAIAAVVSLAAAMAVGLSTWKTSRIWLAYFVVLGVLSTSVDSAWRRGIADNWRQLEAETNLANTIVSPLPGAVAAVVGDPNSGHITFIRLKARPHMIQAVGQAEVSADRLAGYDTVIVVGPHSIAGSWRLLFKGRQLSVLQRYSAGPPAPGLGYDAGTG